CRVSTDSKEQLTSYEAQKEYYTHKIQDNPDWELAGIFADKGLSGTSMKRRAEFNKMIAACKRGKIDLILAKSLSRFARNTRDCLVALRELSALGVTVYFEKENIDTGTLTSELMVSVSGALAQQESISISQNQRMSYRRRMEKGEFITCYAPYGYDLKGQELVINEEQAAVVR
ncbi:recombinase family protein, partial [Clostridioides difficile]|nr:recombinase family protein [Clostridioides difficile]